MEILIRLDEEDRKDIAKLIHAYRTPGSDVKQASNLFWGTMIEKYPYLKNRRIALNGNDHCIFAWNSQRDLNEYQNWGNY